MFRIRRTDKGGASRFVGESHESIGLAVYAMVKMALEEADGIAAFADQCGPHQVAIYIGFEEVIKYEVVEV